MKARKAAAVVACVLVFALLSFSLAQAPIRKAAPVRRIGPTTGPTPPAQTTMLLAALMRYANGQSDGSFFDRQLALRLKRLPHAKVTTKRLVSRVAAMPESTRKALLGPPGGNLVALRYAAPKTSPAARTPGRFQPAAGLALIGDTLPPEPADTSGITGYRLDYTGLWCVKRSIGAQPADKPVIFTTMITHPSGAAPFSYSYQSFPPSGSLSGVVSGTVSTANSGPAWQSSTFNNAGNIFVSALLMDDGTLAQQKQDMEVLFATSEVFASTIPGEDRITPMQAGLTYTTGVLHLSNPQRWSLKAVQSRTLSVNDYVNYWDQAAKQTQGVPWKFQMKHDTQGSDYTVFYSLPTSATPRVVVRVTVLKIAATGSLNDDENGLADFDTNIGIGNQLSGFTVGYVEVSHFFAQDQNEVSSSYWVSRQMRTGQAIPIKIELRERDAPPEYERFSSGILGLGCDYCGSAPPEIREACTYVGPCSPKESTCDINPKPGSNILYLSYDPATGAITGDVTGQKGQVFTSRGDAFRPGRAMIQFKIE